MYTEIIYNLPKRNINNIRIGVFFNPKKNYIVLYDYIKEPHISLTNSLLDGDLEKKLIQRFGGKIEDYKIFQINNYMKNPNFRYSKIDLSKSLPSLDSLDDKTLIQELHELTNL